MNQVAVALIEIKACDTFKGRCGTRRDRRTTECGRAASQCLIARLKVTSINRLPRVVACME